MSRVFVSGIGILGPGLEGWPKTRAILAGDAAHALSSVTLPAVTRLPPAERRRAGTAVKLVVTVGLEALEHAGLDASETATVFTSSGGDSEAIDSILIALASEQREVSPTRFHNSVHNAPSGYWAVACEARAPSTSLCAFDGSFGIGLLDAAVQAVVDGRPVLLIAYDLPYPEPLNAVRPIGGVFGVALVLTPNQSATSSAMLDLALDFDVAAGTIMANADLERLRRTTPAARSLPLLAALASGKGSRVFVDGIDDGGLMIEVAPR